MNYRLLVISALIGMMTSCSKDSGHEQESLVPGTFADINTLNVLPAELYTQKGMITNQEEVAVFINKKGLSNSFFDHGITTLNKEVDLTLVVKEDNTVELKREIPGKAFRALISDYRNRRFVITGIDSITSMVGSAGTPLGSISNPYSISTCGTNLNIGLLEVPRTCVPVLVPPNAYTRRCTYLPIAAIEVENANMLFIPTLSFYFTQGTGRQRCTFGLHNSWNILNAEFYKQLSAGDTVLIQKKQIILKKIT